jgi:hypothetical protein
MHPRESGAIRCAITTRNSEAACMSRVGPILLCSRNAETTNIYGNLEAKTPEKHRG